MSVYLGFCFYFFSLITYSITNTPCWPLFITIDDVTHIHENFFNRSMDRKFWLISYNVEKNSHRQPMWNFLQTSRNLANSNSMQQWKYIFTPTDHNYYTTEPTRSGRHKNFQGLHSFLIGFRTTRRPFSRKPTARLPTVPGGGSPSQQVDQVRGGGLGHRGTTLWTEWQTHDWKHYLPANYVCVR